MVASADNIVRVPPPRFTDTMHRWQRLAVGAFDQGRARFAFLHWHRRARKTTLGLNLLLREAMRHENHTYRHIFPTRAEAKEVIWDDPDMLLAYLPDKKLVPWKLNTQSLSVKFANGSRYVLHGSDQTQETKRGFNCHGAVLDEWGYHESDRIWTAVLRPIITEDASRWTWFVFTANGFNHATRMLETATKSGFDDTYVSVLPVAKSQLMSKVELKRAQLDMPFALYMQEMECSPMHVADMVLIQPVIIERLKSIHHGFTDVRRIVACDVGFEGDECCIYAGENTRVIDERQFHPERTEEVVGAIVEMCSVHGIFDIIIDPIGVGKGAYDALLNMGQYRVQKFDAREAATEDPKKRRYGNLRAQGWWYTRDEMAEGRCVYPADTRLIEQLTNLRFRMAGPKLYMEKKKDARKRLTCSPDRADTFVMMLWGLRSVEPAYYDGSMSADDYGQSSSQPAAALSPMAA